MNIAQIYACDFLTKNGNKWMLTRSLPFKTRYGGIEAPESFETDLYTLVPNTRYPDFWKPSILHDYVRAMLKLKLPDFPIKNVWQSDIVFYDEMLIQSAIIFGKLQDHVGTEMAVDEFQKLLKLSKLYYKGVSGVLGRLYQWIAG